MTSTITRTATYTGPLPDDVRERIDAGRFETMGGGIFDDPETGETWVHGQGNTWHRYAAPPVPHDRSASYAPATRAALAPRDAFTGPSVVGWCVRHDQAARAFVDVDGRKIAHE